ncbi:TPA: hypothetical protein ACFRG8_001988 [Neisseria lactamica]
MPSATAKSVVTRPSPVGEGWGEGIFQIAAIFPNDSTVQESRQPFPTTQPPKYKPCGLSPSL